MQVCIPPTYSVTARVKPSYLNYNFHPCSHGCRNNVELQLNEGPPSLRGAVLRPLLPASPPPPLRGVHGYLLSRPACYRIVIRHIVHPPSATAAAATLMCTPRTDSYHTRLSSDAGPRRIVWQSFPTNIRDERELRCSNSLLPFNKLTPETEPALPCWRLLPPC